MYDVYIQDLSRRLEVKNVKTVQSLTTNLTVVVSSQGFFGNTRRETNKKFKDLFNTYNNNQVLEESTNHSKNVLTQTIG